MPTPPNSPTPPVPNGPRRIIKDEGPSLRDLPKTSGGVPIGSNGPPKSDKIFIAKSQARPVALPDHDPPPSSASRSDAERMTSVSMVRGPRARCPICASQLRPGKGHARTGTVVVGCFALYLAVQLFAATLSFTPRDAGVAPLTLSMSAALAIFGLSAAVFKQRGLRCTACRHFLHT